MNKRQAEKRKAQRALSKRVIAKIEVDNDKAKRRRLARDAAHLEWRKGRVADPMVPFVQTGDTDSRPVLDEGPPVRRAYVHTYGWTREERRVALASHKRGQRQKRRAIANQLFTNLWLNERAHNAPT